MTWLVLALLAQETDVMIVRDLNGWTVVQDASGAWSARDGTIVCGGKGGGLLRTDRMLQDFILELESDGDGSLLLGADALPARGARLPRSIELTSDGRLEARHGARITFERAGERRPAGGWIRWRVTARGGAVKVELDGQEVSSAQGVEPRRGHLCLHARGEARFRNLRLRELPVEGPPLPAALVAAPDPGFRPLLGGVDLRGWRKDPQNEGHWKLEGGVLDYDGRGDHLWTEAEFGDLELIADWRWLGKPIDQPRPVILPDGSTPTGEDGKPRTVVVADAGDSGIYLRGNDKSQVNIWCWPVGSGEVYGYRTDSAQTPEVRAAVTPRARADAPIGEWNRFRITMKGDRLTVVLNGQTVIEAARLPGVPGRGALALQHHGAPIQFANLYVREAP